MDKFSANNKRSIRFIFLILFFGIICGSVITNIMTFILPDGVVRDFFLINTSIGWQPFTVNLLITKITTGFTFDISVCSLIGLFISWYFLKYLK